MARWPIGLLRESGAVLLDRQAAKNTPDDIRDSPESVQGTSAVDLHAWSIGPGRRAAVIAVEPSPPLDLETDRGMLPRHPGLTHVTIEINEL